jgi:2-amino-4-hydroxy-6-hydroxymethyldihydropteridine diphosphokinase
MYKVFILLGSNLGDSKKYLQDAIINLEKKVGIIQAKSSLYQTASWGKLDQPDFINQVIELETKLSPTTLLSTILEIETSLGRERLEKWGSRIIDIDILLIDDHIINDVNLIVPHPFMHVRRFSLMPLSEIASELIHPVHKKTISNLLLELSDNLFVKKIEL